MSDELSTMDATAMAELVSSARRARLSSSMRRSSGSRRSTRAQRGHPPALREGARGSCRGPPRRPLQGRALPAQGSGRRLRGAAAPHGDAGPQGRRLQGTDGHLPGASAFATPGLITDRQDEHAGVRNPADDRAGGLRGHHNPWDTTRTPRWILRRIRRGRRIWHGPDGSRERRRWIDPDPCLEQWSGRAEAVPSAHNRGTAGRRQPLRPDRRVGRLALGPRYRSHSRGRSRPRPGDPYAAPHRCGPTSTSSTDESGGSGSG